MAESLISLEFFFFFGVFLVLLHASRKLSTRRWLLILFNYLFCLSLGLRGAIIVTITAVVDFLVGRRLGSAAGDATRRLWLWIGLAANLAPLAFFKYSGFLAASVTGILHPVGVGFDVQHKTVFPVIGLSYFTFAGMSYLLDVYHDSLEPAQSLSEYVCYLMYFPKLIAGPIVRAAEFLPQIRGGFRITVQDVEIGIAYLLVGAVKKLVIANQLASHVSIILAAPQQYEAFTLVQGMVGYTVQIYADFSGYSDMAIGCARLMGIRFPQNFLMPYSSINIAEFWRRWHVTMSSWFRDYVFLPLEFGSRGAQNPSLRASRNIVITMLLCGLWHGASWNFVAWGGLHGVALAVYQTYSYLLPRKSHQQRHTAFHPQILLARLLTMSVVVVGWVFFGTQSLSIAITYLSRMVTWSKDGVALGSPYIFPIAAFVLLLHVLINKDRNLIEEIPTYSTPVRCLSYASLLLVLACLVPSDTVPFVYAQF
jgi:alginate O-acetyltransferase complex protein AlgI